MPCFSPCLGLTLRRKHNKNLIISSVMNNPVILSSRVIDTINSLPEAERIAVASAISAQLILGADASSALSPIENMLFSMICSYVRHDTAQYERLMTNC